MVRKITLLTVLLGALVILIFFIVRFDSNNPFSLNNLIENKGLLQSYTQDNLLLSSLIFLLFYIFVVSLSIPLAVILALGGGYIFGTLWALVLINLGSVLGALVTYHIAKYLLRDWISMKFTNRLEIINREIEKGEISYLLTLRLIPIFPFFLVNLLIGITRVSLLTFVLTTSLGSIPNGLLYTYTGSRLTTINKINEIMSLSYILTMTCVGLLALSPIIVKKLMK